jgi:hypothetical protein
MPNTFGLKLTRGAMKLERHFDPGPAGVLRPPVGGGGTRAGLPGLSTKGRVSTKWSKRSQRHMRFEFGALPWELLGKRPVMITLTYPGDWDVWVPDARTLHRHREALKARWERRYGTPIGFWVTEFQKRGAPHLHIYIGLPEAVSDEEYKGLRKRTMDRKRSERDLGRYEARRQSKAPKGEFSLWLRTAWWRIVDSQLPAHHGRGVDIATSFWSDGAEEAANRVRVAEYFWRESGKWAQKRPPEGFGSLKFYGRWGQKAGFKPGVTEAEMDERTGLELRRVMRRMQQGKMRKAARRGGWKYRKRAGVSRGRDGLTVFEVDGREIGPRLLGWAQTIAAQKADGPPLTRGYVNGAGQAYLRSWSEFMIAEDEDESAPDTDVIAAFESPEDEWDRHAAELDRLVEAEAAIEAAADAWVEECERVRNRDRRKQEIRKAERDRRRRSMVRPSRSDAQPSVRSDDSHEPEP